MNKTLLFIPITLLFIGCQKQPVVYVDLKENQSANIEQNTKQLQGNKKENIVYEPIITPEEYKKMLQEESSVTTDMNDAFMDFYNEWKHVKYRLGGNSKRGIDCSAFTQRVYKEKFDVKIPRTTRTQVKVGKEIKKSELELGDLVFFKTGRTDRHVGVYMGNGEFMHASIKGVKFTKLDKPFYKKAYWTSRRIIY
jgi:lipoprotein Spr